MCNGIPILVNNEKAIAGYKTNSHSQMATNLKLNEDEWLKFEYHWWDKELVKDYYDQRASECVAHINKTKARKLAKALIVKDFDTDTKLANWLKDVPNEWGHLMDDKFARLAKKVNPKLVIYQDKIAKFKKEKIEKYNPYQATKLPKLEELKNKNLAQVWAQVGAQVWIQVGDQVGAQVGAQVRAQVRDQVWDQVWDQVRAQVRAQVGDQVWAQVGDQVGDQVWDQVGAQVWAQVRAQVWATSYWGVKVVLGLPIKHWFFDFLKLGVMVVFVKGKAKVFGKKGKYLGEYDEKDLFN